MHAMRFKSNTCLGSKATPIHLQTLLILAGDSSQETPKIYSQIIPKSKPVLEFERGLAGHIYDVKGTLDLGENKGKRSSYL